MNSCLVTTNDHTRANTFRLYSEYCVLIGTNTIINQPQRTLLIPEYPQTFREFEDVYQQPQNTLAGISIKKLCIYLVNMFIYDVLFEDVIGLVVHVTKIQNRACGDHEREVN